MNASECTFETKQGENGSVQLTAIVPESVYAEAENEILKEVQPQVEMKGFRKGKVPEHLVRAKHKEYIESEATQKLVEKTWDAAQKEKTIRTFGAPKLTEQKNDGALTFVYTYYPLADITLPNFSNIKIKRRSLAVTDASVDAGYDIYMTMFAMPEDVEDEVKEGDSVVCNLTYAGDALREYDRKGVTFQASGDTDALVIAKAVIGMKKGDTKKVETRLNGEKATITVEAVEVKRKKKLADDAPDDEKAKERAENMKKYLRTQLESMASAKAKREFDEAAVDAVVQGVKITIPKGYLDEYAADLMEQFEHEIGHMNISVSEYLAMINKTREDVQKERRTTAEKIIRRDAIFEEILRTNPDAIIIDQHKADRLAQQTYERQMQQGLDRLPRKDQEDIIRRIVSQAKNTVAAESVLEYIKTQIVVEDLPEEPYFPTETELSQGR